MIERAVSINSFVHLISHGKTYEEMLSNADQDVLKLYQENETMRIKVRGYQKSIR